MQPDNQFTVTIEIGLTAEQFARAMLEFSARFQQAARQHCGCPWCRNVAAAMQPGGDMLPLVRESLEQGILAKATPGEIQVVRDTLARGELGYTGDDCVIAVIARERGTDYYTLMSMRARPFEIWLHALPAGATPATNGIARQLDQWLAEWLDAHPPEAHQPTPAAPAPEVPIELESGLRRDLMFYSRYVLPVDRVAGERTEAERWLRREPLGIARIEV